MDYRIFSKDELIREKQKLEAGIVELKKQIVTVRSQLYCLFIQHKINKCVEKIHSIEAELAYREVHEAHKQSPSTES